MFFFKKRTKKPLSLRLRAVGNGMQQEGKVFCFYFSKKEALAFCFN
jgi:hypothetical protein